MSDELTLTQIEILFACNNTPNRKTIRYLLAEHGFNYIYDNCVELKKQGYFIDDIRFLHKSTGLFSKYLVREFGILPANIGNVLTEKGMKVVREYMLSDDEKS